MDHGLQQMSDSGLNIYGASAISRLPNDLRAFFPAEYHDWHFGLFGHGGRRMWDVLPVTDSGHPIDDHARLRVDWFAREVIGDKDYVLAFPNPKLVLPLQRLGRYLNISRPSVLGIDIHPKFGLWFAYRAVFLTKVRIPEVRELDFQPACESCVERPCQGEKNSHFHLARLACPIASEHKYSMAQIEYHMGSRDHRRKLLNSKH